jgi:uncharacterized protein DUF6922
MYVPEELKALFWDTDLATFDPRAFPDYTIFRVLEHGDRPAIHWLQETFDGEAIRRIVRTERRMTPKSATFWALVYGIPEDEVAALRDVRAA